MKTSKKVYGIVLVLTLSLTATVRAQNLYVLNFATGTIGEYGLDGSTVNASLITGLNNLNSINTGPNSVAMWGNELLVETYNSSMNQNVTVSEYTTAGALVKGSLLALFGTRGMEILGTNLFITGENVVGEYTTSGTLVHASLITGLNDPDGIAISGTNLFVANEDYSSENNGYVSEYTISGQTIAAPLIPGLTLATGIAISGTNLFVASGGLRGKIGEYTTSGQVINASLITGLANPMGLVISGTNLFVANYTFGTIGEYSTSGATVNASLITGLSSPTWIAISPAPPPNLLISQTSTNVTVSWPATGCYTLQQSTNLMQLSWSPSCFAYTTNNGTNSVTIPACANNLFFRLSNP